MDILFLRLKGAIGIKDGLGLDQVEIPFYKFSPGIIYFIGTNGKGKTTVIDNMHFYRCLASRDENLAEHFMLKDSGRTVIAYYKGNIYKSEILIDGITKASEAYLYKLIYEGDVLPLTTSEVNWEAQLWDTLNDGKLGTYDKAVLKLMGSKEIFFNSSFSAAEQKGIAGLKVAGRRDIFYQMTNLNGYEPLCNIGKTFLNGDKAERERLTKSGIDKNTVYEKTKGLYEEQQRLEGEIKSLNDINDRLNVTSESIKEMVLEKSGKEQLIETLKRDLDRTNYDIDVIKQNIARYEERSKQNILNIESKKQKESLLNDAELNNTTEVSDLEIERDSKIEQFDQGNEFLSEINRLTLAAENTHKNDLEQKGLLNKKKSDIGKEIETVTTEIAEYEKEFTRIDKICSNSTKISTKIAEREVVVKTINDLITEETRLVAAKSAKQESEKTHLEAHNLLISESKKTEHEIELKDAKILQYEGEINKIENSGCDSPTKGSSCLYLLSAHQSKTDLPKHIEEKIKLLEDLASSKLKIQNSRKLTEIIENEIKNINTLLEEIKPKIKENASVLAELDKENWVKINEELTQAETTRNNLNSKKKASNILLSDKNRSLKDYKEQLNKIEITSIERLQEHGKQINNLNNLIQKEKEKIQVSYYEKIEDLHKNHFEKVNVLKREIEDLNSKIDNQLVSKLNNMNADLMISETKKKELTETQISTELALKELTTNVASSNQKLNQKQINLDLIESLKAELQFVERDIKDWNFLVNAFDKTGIPILKMENLSFDITNTINELLSIFDNKFRITFETTKLKKDKSDFKEVFDINVVDSNGSCELKKKSTGQKVWIEEAIQLAVTLTNKKIGCDIRTAWIDEKDDGLAEENATKFMTMVEEFYKKSEVNKAYVITHRKSLQDLAVQKIMFEDGYLDFVYN
jgi:exonuclease SbcC